MRLGNYYFASLSSCDLISLTDNAVSNAIAARLRARKMESKCTVVFFDEIDALGRSRVDEGSEGVSQSGGDHSSRRLLAELLIQMTKLSNMNGEDGGESEDGDDYDAYCDDSSFAPSTMSTAGSEGFGFMNERTQTRNAGDEVSKVSSKARVIVVAATNRPEDCDPALLRRFAVRVLVGLPTKNDRKKIIKLLLKDVDHDVTADQLDAIADATEGWSGSDLGECRVWSVILSVSLVLHSNYQSVYLCALTFSTKRINDSRSSDGSCQGVPPSCCYPQEEG